MSYKKCIATGIDERYCGEPVEILSDSIEIENAYITEKGQLIVEFANLDDLQAWNRRVREDVRLNYKYNRSGCHTSQTGFYERGYKHQLWANDFDLNLSYCGVTLFDTNDYALCHDCEEVHEKDNMTYISDEDYYVCDSCLESGYFWCEKCEEWHSDDDRVEMHKSPYSRETYYVCENCAEQIGYCCADCGEWYEADVCQCGADGKYYCDECWCDNFVTCSDCGETLWRDDAYYDEDEDEYEYYCSDCWEDHHHSDIRSYHNNPHLCKHYTKEESDSNDMHERFIGSEIETEGKDDDECTMDDRIETTKEYGHDEDDIYQMHDGSLGDSGIECITQPMSKAYWDKFDFEGWMDALRENGAVSHDSPRCGLHVHLSRTWMMTDDRDTQAVYVGRMRQFISDNQEWVERFCRRSANRWCEYTKTFDKDECKPTDKKEREEAHKEKGKSGDRCQSVNNTNSATIEFRIFRGTLIANTYRASVEFCLRLVDYIISHEEETETMEEFLAYKPLPESMKAYMEKRHLNF